MKKNFSRNLVLLFASLVALACLSARAPAQTLCSECLVGTVSCNGSVFGDLDKGDCELTDGTFIDAYSFTLPAPATITINMRSTEIDCYLVLFNNSCAFLAQNDDCLPGTTDSCLTQSLPAGTYYIGANSYDIETGSYTLSVTCPVIQPTLSIARLPNGDVQVSTDAPGTLQSTAEFQGVNTVWTNIGPILPGFPYVTTPGPAAPIRFYRQTVP